MTRYQAELYHHGILGQKWGKRNGPPYPLGVSDHSSAEKKAGWRKSIDHLEKTESKDYTDNEQKGNKKKIRLTDKQKKAIKIGAAVAVTALAAYGVYRLAKSGKLDSLINSGKSKVQELLSGDIPNEIAKKLPVPETLEETLSKANPLRGSAEGKNNCVPSAIAGFLRQSGYDVTALGTGGIQQNLGGVIEECFKGADVKDGSAIKFGRSPKDAAEMIRKRFGDNAAGVCNIKWKGSTDGHSFNWRTVNGVTSFFDSQNGSSGSAVDSYWRHIDPNGNLTLARLDNAEINWSNASKYIKHS